MSDIYTIKIENFEGPFDLLFHLIEKNKIDIYDIPMAVITEQYLDYLQEMQEMDLEIVSEFLIMAATLLHIKSKMLLPKLKDNEENNEEIDPREELVARLLEYKKYKEFVEDLKEREKQGQLVYYKLPDIIEVDKKSQSQLIGLSAEDLADAFRKILEKDIKEKHHNKTAFTQIVKRESISVAKKVREIVKVLRNTEKIKFVELFESLPTRMEKIATFLAVLELMKLRRVFIEQENNFSEIMIYNNKAHNEQEQLKIE